MCVTIVIPSKNNQESLHHTIKSIESSTSHPHNYIFITDEETSSALENYWGDQIDMRVLKMKDHSIKSMNKGFKESKGHVLLTHDDMNFSRLYKRDWLKEMATIADDKKQGIITIYNGGGISGPKYLSDFRWVGTWCMFIPEHTYKKIGYLDENMTTGDDIDYTFRVVKAGYKIGVIDYWVEHHRSNEKPQDKDIQEGTIVKVNGDYFKKKHGFK